MERQGQVQELYEGRFASLHRLVGFFVMFHAMAKEVQDFWPTVSLGMLGYDMSRSQSIMRIATTASPISGSDVRIKMVELGHETTKLWVVNMIKAAWIRRHGRLVNYDEKSEAEIDAQIEKLMQVKMKRAGDQKVLRARQTSRQLQAEMTKLVPVNLRGREASGDVKLRSREQSSGAGSESSFNDKKGAKLRARQKTEDFGARTFDN